MAGEPSQLCILMLMIVSPHVFSSTALCRRGSERMKLCPGPDALQSSPLAARATALAQLLRISPVRSWGRYFCFCASVPLRTIWLMHRLLWAP